MKYFIVLLFLFVNCCITAQVVSGIIRDSDYLPIMDANVINLRNKLHVHTDHDGRFDISDVAIRDTISISHVGYKARTIIISSLEEKLDLILEDKTISLSEVVISPELNALNIITKLDLQTNPVTSSQEVLTQVPGLFIGQHAGGGKAEQIFLRGFDIDHGTDIAITVDGLPVNMVSHAHGQGYADLHFLIPETIDNIDFGKGPYRARVGNLNTAGYIDFRTKENLNNSTLKMEYGQFGMRRLLGMIDLNNSDNEKISPYVAAEYISMDGPFDSPQNFNRINVFSKLKNKISETENVTLTLSHFTSKWDASGQIPERAVDTISRFGAIDDTEGGTTSRTNALVRHQKILNNDSYITSKLFYTRYNFELYSNFTFFLEDPINGDQIRQQESRDIFGLQSEYHHGFDYKGWDGEITGGVQWRSDIIYNNELSRTANRQTTLESIQLGDITETNTAAYVSSQVSSGPWTIHTGVRFDHFEFQYVDALLSTYSTQSNTKSTISPKLSLLYNYTNNLQLYVKSGKGFHSNDTRVIVAENGEKILPAAYGSDFGLIWKPRRNIIINAAYWYLFSEQEFVYVGDAGIVEPSGEATRNGIDLSIRYQPLSWLLWNMDANLTDARASGEEAGNDYIPLAPRATLVSGLQVNSSSGLYGGLHARYIGNRPANEDNSIIAKGYTIFSLNAGFQKSQFDIGIQIENLLNSEWNETQFATETRLANENSPVEEIHFTPGTPFFLKCSVAYKF